MGQRFENKIYSGEERRNFLPVWQKHKPDEAYDSREHRKSGTEQ